MACFGSNIFQRAETVVNRVVASTMDGNRTVAVMPDGEMGCLFTDLTGLVLVYV